MSNIVYNVGLDLGTNSIGWSVTSNDFRVIKKGKQKLWGVVLFEEGKSSKDYRTFRSSRRRLERRRVRINLLQDLMTNSIEQVDSTFLKRLNMSFLCNEIIDKNSKRNYRYNIFNDSMTDVEFYGKFRTIYHLRHYLMNSKQKEDIRYIYLALHHIAKYRGNFLHQEEELEVNSINVANSIDCLIKEYFIDEEINPDILLSELTKNNITKKDREKNVTNLFANKNLGSMCAKLLLGYSVDQKLFKKAFTIEEDIESTKLQFGNDEFDANMEKLSKFISSKETDMILCIKSIFEDLMLIKILGEGNETVSVAMINRYEKHKHDLKILKATLKNNKKLYNEMFKSDKISNNYVSYVNKIDKGVKSGKRKCPREDFYTYVEKCLSGIENNQYKEEILRSILEDNFMPLINDVINSNIPYQLNYNEAKKILDNQRKYYPELEENYEKILKLIRFRRPYSVGVLNPNSKFSWLPSAPNEKILPWNFDELVNIDVANENFIKKMVTKDVFTGEFVLPLESITYQKFIVLNEINNIRYKSSPINNDIKKKLFELFKMKLSISCNDICKIYKNEFNIDCISDDFSGFSDVENKKFISSMSTYIKLKKLFNEDFKEKDIKLYDEIVEKITIFKDRNVLQSVLEKLFIATSHQYLRCYIPKIIRLSFNKWGKYSYKLLEGILSKENNPQTINELLYNTQNNFMQIINDNKYGFKEMFINKKSVEHPTYENLIEDLYASSSVKKTIWTAYKVISEIVRIMGCQPHNIFIETTREEQTKKKTISKKDIINALYKSLGDDIRKYELENVTNEFSNIEKIDKDKLYLYFLQLGRCMYTNKPIDINNLNECEIDHIIPRCYIKDDSFDNRVLVYKELNQRKSDLALSDAVRENCKEFWNFLYTHGNKTFQFMSKKKYENLMMSSWDTSSISGFINRQLVETTQINKLTRDVLINVYPELENNIKFVNSGLVSLFRNCQGSEDVIKYGNFYKVRNLNDLHHAKDAYLVSVLGIFTSENFPAWGQDERALLAKMYLNSSSSKASTKELVNARYGVIIDKIKSLDYECTTIDGEYIVGKQAFDNIITMMDFNDIAVVKLKEAYANSNFYDQTIYSPKCNKKLVARKQIKDINGNNVDLDPKLYGGYSNVNDAYYLSIIYQERNKSVSKLVGIPVYIAEQVKNMGSNKPIELYLENIGYSNFIIDGKPILKNQLICYHGQKVYITGDSEIVNAQQLLIDKKYLYMLKCICEENNQKISGIDDFRLQAIEFVKFYVGKIRKYYPLYCSIADKIEEFANNGLDCLSNDDISKYIKNLLVITHSGSSRIDMPKEWNGGSGWGRLSGKTISKADDNIQWMDASITGYYSTVR